MIIRTTGKPKMATIRECKQAVMFAVGRLLSDKMQAQIRVKLWFSEKETRERGWDGYCDWLDDNLKPRDFVIALDPGLPKQQLFSVIMHENVHLKQFATGQLKDYIRMKGWVGWMGKLHRDSRGDKVSTPWEQEALRREKTLYKHFKAYLDTV